MSYSFFGLHFTLYIFRRVLLKIILERRRMITGLGTNSRRCHLEPCTLHRSRWSLSTISSLSFCFLLSHYSDLSMYQTSQIVFVTFLLCILPIRRRHPKKTKTMDLVTQECCSHYLITSGNLKLGSSAATGKPKANGMAATD